MDERNTGVDIGAAVSLVSIEFSKGHVTYSLNFSYTDHFYIPKEQHMLGKLFQNTHSLIMKSLGLGGEEGIIEAHTALQTLKMLDDETDILKAASTAIDTLHSLKNESAEESASLTLEKLAEKKQLLIEYANNANNAKYAAMGLEIASGIFAMYLCIQNENYQYANNGFLNELCKMSLRALIAAFTWEAPIHAYKVKRYFADLSNTAKVEIATVDQAMKEYESVKLKMS